MPTTPTTTGAYQNLNPDKVRATLAFLRRCQAIRRAAAEAGMTFYGFVNRYDTFGTSTAHDPEWLINTAINRKAGWPEDPTLTRGSAMPLPDGRFPPKAGGDDYGHLCRLARDVNSRILIRVGELGTWRKLLTTRLPHRFEEA